ncbi:MAG: dimethylsulfoniopropionate demethylase, partial [Acidiferrobacteraceae bacterium]|nr:dimethylsulfoniopropionate demethylase [Acidiferrobacteraceae bacterium]
QVGQITSAIWSPLLKKNVALSLIQKDHWDPGTQVAVHLPQGNEMKATIVKLPFDPPR